MRRCLPFLVHVRGLSWEAAASRFITSCTDSDSSTITQCPHSTQWLSFFSAQRVVTPSRNEEEVYPPLPVAVLRWVARCWVDSAVWARTEQMVELISGPAASMPAAASLSPKDTASVFLPSSAEAAASPCVLGGFGFESDLEQLLALWCLHMAHALLLEDTSSSSSSSQCSGRATPASSVVTTLYEKWWRGACAPLLAFFAAPEGCVQDVDQRHSSLVVSTEQQARILHTTLYLLVINLFGNNERSTTKPMQPSSSSQAPLKACHRASATLREDLAMSLHVATQRVGVRRHASWSHREAEALLVLLATGTADEALERVNLLVQEKRETARLCEALAAFLDSPHMGSSGDSSASGVHCDCSSACWDRNDDEVLLRRTVTQPFRSGAKPSIEEDDSWLSTVNGKLTEIALRSAPL